MAIVVAEIVIDGYRRRQLSSEDLWTICSTVGIKPNCCQQEGNRLAKKLKLWCKDLQLLLNCTGLESVFSTIEELGKRSLQELAIQHQLDPHKAWTGDMNDIRT